MMKRKKAPTYLRVAGAIGNMFVLAIFTLGLIVFVRACWALLLSWL